MWACTSVIAMYTITLSSLVLLTLGDPGADLIARAQSSEQLSSDLRVPRVVKDDEGSIVGLRLDGMRLSEDEFKALGRMTTLRSIGLNKTNIVDADLKHLQGLTKLQSLALNSTELSDAAVEDLANLPALKTLCLGSVRISPAAIERLKDLFRAQDRRLSLGYSSR